MDLIEPYIVVTHDMIDFDVNNLSLDKDCLDSIGLRVDITKDRAIDLSLEKIVDNIKAGKLNILRTEDKFMTPRVEKMKNRGWQIVGRYAWAPNQGRARSSPSFHLYLT